LAELVNPFQSYLQGFNEGARVLTDGAWHTLMVGANLIGRFRGNPEDYKSFYAVRV